MPTIEKEANKLAGRILMPENAVNQLMNIYKTETITYKTRKIMENFMVSFTASHIRLQELGYDN